MPRYRNNLIVATEDNIETIFDGDFIENEEYFREDTLSLGYNNEMERVFDENRNKEGNLDIDNIVQIAFSDKSYYINMQYQITNLDSVKVISISYMTVE